VKKLTEQPEALKPYLFHGVDLNWRDGDRDATGPCPICGSEKFNVKLANGFFDCWKCQTIPPGKSVDKETGRAKSGGNASSFLRMIHAEYATTTTMADYTELAEDRSIAYAKTLEAWGVVKSRATSDWLVPGYNVKGQLTQLYQYMKTQKGMRLLPTPGLGHQLHGMNLWNKKAEEVFVCEGIWDAIALWEVFGKCKWVGEELKPTANIKESLLSSANVVAIPGIKVFLKSWPKLFRGKDIYLMFDSDYPTTVEATGKELVPDGYAGAIRISGILSSGSIQPKSIEYLDWGVKGYDPDLPDGYDVRDTLAATPERGLRGRIEALDGLLGKLGPLPGETARKASMGSSEGSNSGGSMTLQECHSYQDLQTAWKKALKWTDGLDRALSAMLACIISTNTLGDQIWLKVLSPAASGKSTLCEALSTAREYVYPKDTFTGLSSGYQTDDSGSENLSLVEKIKNKTLIINDGDTLLKLPNLEQILSQLRAFYGRNLRTSFKNKMSTNHEGISTTIILCGTSSLRKLDASELGARFLDVVIMESIDRDLEREIAWRKVNQAFRSVKTEADGKPETLQEPEMTAVMQLTGGYVEYLRENALELLGQVEIPNQAKQTCMDLGEFVALMRARPSIHHRESNEREVSARLVSQLARLAVCTAAVLNRSLVDGETMRRVRQVALDTARGHTMGIAKILYDSGNDGIEAATLVSMVDEVKYETHALLRFLKKIGVANTYHPESKYVRKKVCWRLTKSAYNLWGEVIGDE